MFVFVSYDVSAKYCSVIQKICSRYFVKGQMSVFSGTLSQKKFKLLKREIKEFKEKYEKKYAKIDVKVFVVENEKNVILDDISTIEDSNEDIDSI